MNKNNQPERIPCYVIAHVWDQHGRCLNCRFTRQELYGNEAVEHRMQRTVENVPPKFSYCGWCGWHREGDPNDGSSCSACGGRSWLPCTLGCLEHSTAANA